MHIIKLIEREGRVIKVAWCITGTMPALVEFPEKLLILEIGLSDNVRLALPWVHEGLTISMHLLPSHQLIQVLSKIGSLFLIIGAHDLVNV